MNSFLRSVCVAACAFFTVFEVESSRGATFRNPFRILCKVYLMYTTIKLRAETKEALNELKLDRGESYDNVIRRLIELAESTGVRVMGLRAFCKMMGYYRVNQPKFKKLLEELMAEGLIEVRRRHFPSHEHKGQEKFLVLVKDVGRVLAHVKVVESFSELERELERMEAPPTSQSPRKRSHGRRGSCPACRNEGGMYVYTPGKDLLLKCAKCGREFEVKVPL